MSSVSAAIFLNKHVGAIAVCRLRGKHVRPSPSTIFREALPHA